ncbi:hypothetical protein INR49_003277, partial [Caranx melampygus]
THTHTHTLRSLGLFPTQTTTLLLLRWFHCASLACLFPPGVTDQTEAALSYRGEQEVLQVWVRVDEAFTCSVCEHGNLVLCCFGPDLSKRYVRLPSSIHLLQVLALPALTLWFVSRHSNAKTNASALSRCELSRCGLSRCGSSRCGLSDWTAAPPSTAQSQSSHSIVRGGGGLDVPQAHDSGTVRSVNTAAPPLRYAII